MRSTPLEARRGSLQQSLILVIMALVTMTVYLSHAHTNGNLISVLSIVILVACLYVLVTERRLSNREASLLQELFKKDRAVDHLGRELVAGRFELKEKMERAQELEGRLKEITMLYRAINRVNDEARNDKVTYTALQSALELVGGDRGSIMLLDTDKQCLTIETMIGVDQEIVRQSGQKIGEGVAGWVAEFGEPVRINGDAQDDDRFQNPSKLAAQIRSALCIPLNLRQETIGVMNIGLTQSEGNEFTDYHMSLATIFGQHASVAIRYSVLLSSLGEEDLLRAP